MTSRILLAFVVACTACGSATQHVGTDAAIVTTGTMAGAPDGATTSDAATLADGATLGDASTSKGDADMSSSISGCGTKPAHTSNYSGTALDGKGKTRTFDVYLPSPYDASTPLALTFAYHGAGGKSSDAEGYGIQSAKGAAAASIFVFPQGIPFQTDGVGWDDTCAGYDMVLFDNIVAAMEKSYCIDDKRIFVAGFSWGCDQVTALACCRGHKIRAVSGASCSDEFNDESNDKTYQNSCTQEGESGIRFTHDASGGDTAYAAPEFTTTSKLYQSWNGCPAFTGTLAAGQCHTYAGCAEPFIECPYTGLGHTTPPNWGADTWSFFDTFK